MNTQDVGIPPWRYLRRLLFHWLGPLDENERAAILNYLKKEFRLMALCQNRDAAFREVFTKYGGSTPEGAQSPQILAALNDLRVFAHELLRRHSGLGPVSQVVAQSYLAWHEYYRAYDEAIAAEFAVASGYAEGARPDIKRKHRLFEREERLRKRAMRQQARVLDLLGLDFEQLRGLIAEAERAAETDGNG